MAFFRNIMVLALLAYGINGGVFDGNRNPIFREIYGNYSDKNGESYADQIDSPNEFDDDILNPPLQSSIDESYIVEPRDKKSQTLCRVRKIQKYHHETGYEFHPKQYNEYECLPFIGEESDLPSRNADTCSIHHGECIDIQKYYYYMKKKLEESCWTLQRKIVNAGCKCISPLVL